MTEAEWFAADDRGIDLAIASLDPRRQRLVAAAACRVLEKWIDFPAVHRAIEVIETFADTGKTKVALRKARQAIVRTRDELYNSSGDLPGVISPGVGLALFVVQVAASENAVSGTVTQAMEALVITDGIPVEIARRQMYPVYRDVADPPKGRVEFSPEWRTSTATQLARGMYKSHDFSAMPILADALQDAGCDVADVLDHCRDANQPHVRGCWVVDLVSAQA